MPNENDYLPIHAESPYRPVRWPRPFMPMQAGLTDGMRMLLKLQAIADQDRAEGWLVGWQYTCPLDGSGTNVPRGIVAGRRT